MKRLTFAVLLLLLAVPAVIAQDEKPKAAAKPDIELMHLFAKEGRSWTHRVVHWTRGESPIVETSTDRVTKVDEDGARVEGETTDFSGTSTESHASLVSLHNPDADLKALVADDLPAETLDLGFRKFECRKQVKKEEGLQVTTWTSTEFHPLVVKQVTFQGDYTEIRKLTGFDSAEVDPWLLYRMVGRHWKYKFTSKFGGEEKVTYYTYGVTAAAAESATLSVKAVDDGGNEISSNESEMPFDNASLKKSPDAPTTEVKSCEAGDFTCQLTEVAGAKMWVSTQWRALTVFVESKDYTMELVEFDLGHDAMKFYRTAGNTYTTHSVTEFQAMKIEQSMTYKISKVEDGTATFVTINKDANGKQTFRNETGIDLPDTDGNSCPYTDQVEELVVTPAGNFPAIRTEVQEGETVIWMWNGITVRSEVKMDDISVVTELTELTME